MARTAIATDTNSGITQKQADRLGLFLLPMTFTVNGVDYREGIDLRQYEFYKLIADPKTDVSTTQPSPGQLTEFWNRILSEYDELVYIPMSSGLSSSCQTAKLLAEEEFKDKVFVVDNHRISVTQYQSVADAIDMARAGSSAAEICARLEEDASQSSIYIMVNRLTYLKRGGRVTASGALIANVMNLKPVLQIQGDKLDAYSKCRGTKAAKASMIAAMKKDFETRFKEFADAGEMTLHYAYSDMTVFEVESWKAEIQEAFPGYPLHGSALSLSIGCHIGPGSLAIACSKITTSPASTR